MSKRLVISVVCVVVLVIGYYVISNYSNNAIVHSKINVSEVDLFTINDKSYKIDDKTNVVTKIISLYNEAKVFKKDGDTTAGYIIKIQLKNGQIINVAGTTQGFHYVNDGKKSYKISSLALSQYLKSEIK
jgi:hypothetical protein